MLPREREDAELEDEVALEAERRRERAAHVARCQRFLARLERAAALAATLPPIATTRARKGAAGRKK
jgi:hypothetical protein